jgi:hypothetical protein
MATLVEFTTQIADKAEGAAVEHRATGDSLLGYGPGLKIQESTATGIAFSTFARKELPGDQLVEKRWRGGHLICGTWPGNQNKIPPSGWR